MKASAGLPRSARLTRPADFAALGRAAAALGTRHFVARYRTSPSGHPRMAQSVSKRVHKHAVQRNRIKRQIRTAFRLRREHMPSLDMLIIARVTAAAVDNHVLAADLATLLQRLAALKLQHVTGTMPG